jgi:hypothetical protein
LNLDPKEVLSAKWADAQTFIGYLSQHFYFADLNDIITLNTERQLSVLPW